MSSLSPRHHAKFLLCLLSLAAASLLTAGCGGAIDSVTATTGAGPAFIVGTDAPLASVTSFAVQVQGINAIDSSGKSVALLSGSPTVDFARFNGLQTLLDMNSVPVGTYTSVAITLGPATIGYLNTVAGSAPTIQTQAATLTSSTINITLAAPLIISQTQPVGLRVDFDLRKSIKLDSGGQITGQVTPTFNVKAVGTSDTDAYIDEFNAAVVSVNTTAQSFVIQDRTAANSPSTSTETRSGITTTLSARSPPAASCKFPVHWIAPTQLWTPMKWLSSRRTASSRMAKSRM